MIVTMAQLPRQSVSGLMTIGDINEGLNMNKLLLPAGGGAATYLVTKKPLIAVAVAAALWFLTK